MLPIHSGAISGVTSELQERANYQTTVQEIRANGSTRVQPVRRVQPNGSADDVKHAVNPDARGSSSDHDRTVSYDAIVSQLQEEEKAKKERSEKEAKAKEESPVRAYPPPIDFLSPGVIVSRGEPNRSVAKLFLKAVASAAPPIVAKSALASSLPSVTKRVDVKV